MDSESQDNARRISAYAVEGNANPGLLIDLFERSVVSIEAAYRDLNHTLGWRFLTSPKVTLALNTGIGLITLNPGGDREVKEHPRASCESGSSYLEEAWPGSKRGQAPLQRQIQTMLGALANHIGDTSPLSRFMNERVLSAQFVPFRSPNFKALPQRKASIAFAQSLWRDVLAHWQPRLLITMDNQTNASLRSILAAQPGMRVTQHEKFPTGWGDYQAEVVCLSRADLSRNITLARLPHLSGFTLFGRPASEAPMHRLLSYLADGLIQR